MTPCEADADAGGAPQPGDLRDLRALPQTPQRSPPPRLQTPPAPKAVGEYTYGVVFKPQSLSNLLWQTHN